MNIGIFSSTPHLWDTTIKFEVLDILQNNHSIVVIKEYDDVNLGRLEKGVIVHDLSYMNNNLTIPIVDSIRKSIRLKKEIINYYSKIIDILIIHSDVDFKSIIYISLLNKNTKVVRRAPSPLIAPQNDWIWQKGETNIFRHLIETIYFFYFLYPLITRCFIKSRLKLIPTKNKLYSHRYTKLFDHSYCYSVSCKNALATMYEKSKIIKYPKSANSKIFPNGNKLLLLLSNDIFDIMTFTDYSREDAKVILFKKISEIIVFSENNNLNTYLKLKYDDESIREYVKNNYPVVNLLDTKSNLNEIINEYKYIVGFNTTPIWRQSLINRWQILISLQLLDCDFYNFYQQNKRVQFVESMNDVQINRYNSTAYKDSNDSENLIESMEKLS